MSDNSLPVSAADAVDEAAVAAPESDATAGTDAANETPENAEPKTFTQEELDTIIAKEKAKVERKLRRELTQAAQEPPAQTLGDPPDPKDFKTPLEYADALAEHKANIKLAEREVQKQQQTAASTYNERAEAVREKYTDFDEVVHDDLPISPFAAQVIMASEIGPELAYHLGKNPDEAARIFKLEPLQQAREIGRIEASLAANPTPVKKASSAPDPIKPVGSRSTNPSYDPTDPRSDKLSTSDWMELRNRQLMTRAKQG